MNERTTTPARPLASLFRRPYRELERLMGHRFRDQGLLETALTHPSYRFETPGVDRDNQRLEFLGDAVLSLVAAERLYRERTNAEEGALTEARSRLTSTRTLARVAARIDLGRFLRTGRGERASGGQTRASNLCDVLEALIGATFLDGGLRAANDLFERLFEPELDQPAEDHHNPKGLLQERIQALFQTQPVYRVLDETGPAHARQFTVEVRIGERALAQGEGASKRAAEAQAALRALKNLHPEGPSATVPT